MLNLALYQPDIPQNVGSAIRLCACLGITLDIIEPCGFPWDEKKIRAAAMDYMGHVHLTRHESWNIFQTRYSGRRLVLLTTKADTSWLDFKFHSDDILLAGRESAGVPEEIHQKADARIVIPMHAGLRSLNVVNACAMILGEAIRQTGNHHAS